MFARTIRKAATAGCGIVVFWCIAAQRLSAGEAGAVSLTIYSTARPGGISPDLYRPVPGQHHTYAPQPQVPGYAVVKQERDITLDKLRSEIRFTDVAALIDPTTVTFTSLSAGAETRVLEQNFQFDLVNTQRLMQRYIDREITVEQARGDEPAVFRGTLLSTSDGILLRAADGTVQVINGYSSVRFPELPGGLISRPTLVWDIETQKPGKQRARVTYQTAGITWWADYNVVFTEGKDANSALLDVSAWVSIINQSGATYENARLKLIAGDVHRVEPLRGEFAHQRFATAEAVAPSGFEEKAFFEYHLYTLGRPSTLPDKSTKQIELFPTVRAVPAEKVLVYYGLAPHFPGFLPNPVIDRHYGTQTNKKVDIYLRFKNEKKAGMGIPLPSGRIRVSKMDPADESLEFIGEDMIDHTPKDETVQVRMGSAFDVVGERRQVDFQIDTERNWMEEQIEIKLRNHKEEAVRVIARENLYRWVNWEITAKSHAFEKTDARTIEFPVQIKPDGEQIVRYTVRYSW